MTISADIDRKKAALDAIRPLSLGSVAALDHWYDVELTYTSNALEGNTLTRSETAIVMEKGITVSGKPLRDHLEAAGHKDALVYMRDLAKANAAILESDIRNLHRLIMQKVAPEEAGRYTLHQRMISGSPLLLPSPAEIPPLMRDFTQGLPTAPYSFISAFDAHERLVTIHPFSDGNGRTARLLMNLLLLKTGFPPVIILPEDRPAYHEALQSVQLEHDRDRYHAFLLDRLNSSLDRYLRILRLGSTEVSPAL